MNGGQIYVEVPGRPPVEVRPGESIIGRSRTAQVQVPDSTVSRQHARLVVTGPGEVEVEDLGSANGTYVNGEKLAERRKLADGDRLLIGDAELRVRIAAPVAASEATVRLALPPLGAPQAGTTPAMPPATPPGGAPARPAAAPPAIPQATPSPAAAPASAPPSLPAPAPKPDARPAAPPAGTPPAWVPPPRPTWSSAGANAASAPPRPVVPARPSAPPPRGEVLPSLEEIERRLPPRPGEPVKTPESPAITRPNPTLAGFGVRLVAALVDAAILSLASIGIYAAVFLLAPLSTAARFSVAYGAVMAVCLLYDWVFWAVRGATPGKIMLGLTIVGAKGEARQGHRLGNRVRPLARLRRQRADSRRRFSAGPLHVAETGAARPDRRYPRPAGALSARFPLLDSPPVAIDVHSTSSPGAATSSRRLQIVGWLGGVALGLVLVVAAVLKALDPMSFAADIARQGAAFGLPPHLVAILALILEAGLGVALIVNLRRRPVMVAATLLVAFFLLLTARGAWRAAHGASEASASCGCFGNLVERTPGEAFAEDALLLVPALALAWFGMPGGRRAPRIRIATAAGWALLVGGFALAAPRLPIDDWATRLRPGVELAEICAGSGANRVCLPTAAPALARGRHLVVIADASAADFPGLAKRLNAYVKSGAEPSLAVLADLSPERQQALYWQVAPAFDLQPTPQALLRPLYRRLPRGFLVEDGKVIATWPGLPPQIPEKS